MAKLTGINTNISGNVGQYQFRQTKYGTIVTEAPRSTVRRTERQMGLRTQFANLGAIYKHFNNTLRKGFEDLQGQMSVYNAFVQANIGAVRVYLSKQDAKNGACVLAPYQVTRGSLPSIAVNEAQGVLKTDLSLGGLTVNASTTVAQLSAAILSANDDWQEGDQLNFYYGVQTLDAVTGVPRAKIKPSRVMISTEDESTLWDVVPQLGFSNVGGFLGTSAAIVSGAAAWVHSRETASGLKVSTQFFWVNNPILAQYQTAQAFNTSAVSYGGLDDGRVFLQPTSGGSGSVQVPTGGGAGSGGGSGSGSGTGSGSGSGTGTSPDPTGGDTGDENGGGSGNEGGGTDPNPDPDASGDE